MQLNRWDITNCKFLARKGQVLNLQRSKKYISHDLNLASSKAGSVSQIQYMLDVIRSISLFFKYSPKRQLLLEECIKRAKQQNDVYF